MYVVYIGPHKDTQLEQFSPIMSDIKGERLYVVESEGLRWSPRFYPVARVMTAVVPLESVPVKRTR